MKNQICIITLTIFFSILTFNTTSADIVTEGLVSYWTFDKNDMINKTLKDVWGENNATIHGNPKSVAGKVGEAFKFDGVNDYIDLTTLGDFGEQLGKSTFEAWIRTSNKKDWMTLINNNGDECPNWGISMNGIMRLNGFDISEGVVYLRTSLRTVDGRSCGSAGSGSSYPIFDGKWHHFVYTIDYTIHAQGGSGDRYVYLDGVKGSKGIHSFGGGSRAFFPFTTSVILGARKTNGIANSFFDGYIDEVRLYNRPLTEDQVLQNYNSRDPFNVEPKGKLATLWGRLKQ